MDYEQFKAKVYKLTSIDLNAYKERQMKRRIESLIAKNGFSGFEDYMRELQKKDKIFEEFVNYLTINVSEFYRNPEQWKVLEKEVVPYLREASPSSLKVWSAACSTGDEPYSLVMMLSAFFPLNKIHIIATDIDKQVIEKAKVGLYSEKSIAGVPDEYKKKYFQKIGNSYKINDDIKNCVEFREHNLLKDPYPKNMDLIVCRNVMIYFTEEAKEEIYKRFHQALRPGGVLFVGSTEQMIQYRQLNFTSMKSFFYKKL